MSYLDLFEQWKHLDEQTRKELSTFDAVFDSNEIEDRFYRDLEFGTGGLRGIMGAGTNRMNKYTVGKATKGLANYLIEKFGLQLCTERGVAIAYDTRNNSEYFAQVTANVLSGLGVKVYLFNDARPTPQLSFAVKYLQTLAGVVITASHNPKEYNGYKVYDDFGCQLVPMQAEELTKYVEAVSDYSTVNFGGNDSLITKVDVTNEYVEECLKQSRIQDIGVKNSLKVVYTPLHGSGYVPVMQVLKSDGFDDVIEVKEQSVLDGNFPTVVSPNPEDRKALELGITVAREYCADIVLGTDPDSDRVGVAVKIDTGYELLTGNQIGALLIDFILLNTNLKKFAKPAVIKTEVTSELGAEIARRYGVNIFSTLTGFKFIGEKITQFNKAKIEGNDNQNFDFLFGYEESYGYLAGTHAQDKDGVVSAMLICEMSAHLKAQGKTLLDRINEIYAEYGYYLDALDSFTLKGKDGLERINLIMKQLREEGAPFTNVTKIIDYTLDVAAEFGFGNLPKSNVLKYIFEDSSWIAARPSGTEPKIKFYYSIKGENQEVAKERLKEYQIVIRNKFGIE